MKKNWIVKPKGDEAIVNQLSQALGIDENLANILAQRGVKNYEEAKAFFRPELSHLHDPFLMKDMQEAVDRIEKAINNNEKIMIYGDYDVDGTTSVALLYAFLKDKYANLDYYIPDRYGEGYGISIKGIDYAHENGFSLIIALDCGIKAVEKIQFANEKNVDFIICDHHNPGDSIPDAVAVLDPKRNDCNYPFKELSGCGVGFKLIHAFAQTQLMRDLSCSREEVNYMVYDEILNYLDLVAVSIASDIVPIVGENRVLTYYGLKQLNSSPRIGLKSIIRLAGVEHKEIVVSDCVFKIGPRINAAGRIESGKKSVELLVATDDMDARDFAEKIDDFNTERKDLDTSITQDALDIIANDPVQLKKKSTLLYKEDWHKGVIGIVASRLIDTYYRPTIVLTRSEGVATGSARSVLGYNLYAAIESCSDLLQSFGGHMYAAGLTIAIEDIPEFEERFEKYVAETITPDLMVPRIEIDTHLDFTSITPKFFRILEQFSPFGPENMSPVFITEKVTAHTSTKTVGKKHEHLKLDVVRDGKILSGIAFHKGHFYNKIKDGQEFDICYSISKNEFNGKEYIQLRIKDIKLRDA